jgi:uncharacterized protein YkwD
LLVAATSWATDVAPGAVPPAETRWDAAEAGLARNILDLVNRHRTARGLPALTADPRIGREAQRHSAAMAAGSTPLGHAGFPDRIAALRRVMSCGSSAENVASSLGYDEPAPEIVRGWLASRGHRANIEGRYERTGIGVTRSATGKLYVTQIFVGR